MTILYKSPDNHRSLQGPWGSLVILPALGAGDPSSNLGGPTSEYGISLRKDISLHMPEAVKHNSDLYNRILQDKDFRRWHSNVGKNSLITGDKYLRC